MMTWIKNNKIKISILAAIVLASASFGAVKIFKNEEPQAAVSQEIQGAITEAPGWWLRDHFGYSVCETAVCESGSDPDEDGLYNWQEYFYKTSPVNRDTNGNGLSDGEDVAFGYDPSREGKVTFEEAGSDDSIVGESLVYNTELKELVLDMTDLSRILLPQISDSELIIKTVSNQAAFTEYMLEMDRVVKKYDTENSYEYLGDAIKSGNAAVISEFKLKAARIESDLRQVAVPADSIDLHKYLIALWRTLPKVLDTPSMDVSSPAALYDDSINAWYDNVQAMIALNQKIVVELQKLRNQYEFQIP